MKDQHIEVASAVASAASGALSKIAPSAMWGGSFSAFLFGLMGSPQAGIIGGLLFAAFGAWLKWREHKMRTAEHALRMANAGGKPTGPGSLA